MAVLATKTTTGGVVGDTTSAYPGYAISSIISDDGTTGIYIWEVTGDDSGLSQAEVQALIDADDGLIEKGNLDASSTELPAANAGDLYRIDAAVTLGGEDLPANAVIRATKDSIAADADFADNWAYFYQPTLPAGTSSVYLVNALTATFEDNALYFLQDVGGTVSPASGRGIYYTDGGYFQVIM